MESVFASSLFVFCLCALISRLESQQQTPHVYTKSPLIVNLSNEICCTCEKGTDPTYPQISLTLQSYDDHVSETRSASSDVNNTVCYVIEAMTVSYHHSVAACTATFATGETTVKKTLAVFNSGGRFEIVGSCYNGKDCVFNISNGITVEPLALKFCCVHMKISKPIITGPSTVVEGENYVWACAVDQMTYDSPREVSLDWCVDGERDTRHHTSTATHIKSIGAAPGVLGLPTYAMASFLELAIPEKTNASGLQLACIARRVLETYSIQATMNITFIEPVINGKMSITAASATATRRHTHASNVTEESTIHGSTTKVTRQVKKGLGAVTLLLIIMVSVLTLLLVVCGTFEGIRRCRQYKYSHGVDASLKAARLNAKHNLDLDVAGAQLFNVREARSGSPHNNRGHGAAYIISSVGEHSARKDSDSTIPRGVLPTSVLRLKEAMRKAAESAQVNDPTPNAVAQTSQQKPQIVQDKPARAPKRASVSFMIDPEHKGRRISSYSEAGDQSGMSCTTTEVEHSSLSTSASWFNWSKGKTNDHRRHKQSVSSADSTATPSTDSK